MPTQPGEPGRGHAGPPTPMRLPCVPRNSVELRNHTWEMKLSAENILHIIRCPAMAPMSNQFYWRVQV